MGPQVGGLVPSLSPKIKNPFTKSMRTHSLKQYNTDRGSENPVSNKKGYMFMSRTVPNWVKAAKPHFCAACGTTDDLQYHHLVPTSLGGKTEPTNIIVLCGPCHQKWHRQGGKDKHNRLVKEGIAKARERGVVVGRKPADAERIMRIIAENSTQFQDDKLVTETEIMEMLDVQPSCYHKYKRRLLALMNADEWPFEWEKPKKLRNMPLYDRVVKNLRNSKLA